MMLTLDPFNDGKPHNYAFGVRIDEYKNEKKISHSGSIGGYRSYACTYPEHETEVVILTNFSSSGVGGKINVISDILFDKPETQTPEMNFERKDVDMKSISGFFGTYNIENVDTRYLDIYSEADTIFSEFTGGRKTRLYTASDSILFNNTPGIKISLINSKPEQIRITYNGEVRKGTKTIKYRPEIKDLMQIAGEYWSPELETQYRFYLKKGKIYGYQTRHGEFELECLRENILISKSGNINRIELVRRGKKVIGMKVSNSRVRNLLLEKR